MLSDEYWKIVKLSSYELKFNSNSLKVNSRDLRFSIKVGKLGNVYHKKST